MKKTYIAGRVTGIPYHTAVKKFWLAERTLSQTTKVINPILLCKEEWSWLRCMIVCVWNLVVYCDSIYLIDNWSESRGARIEVLFAVLFKKKIIRKIVIKHGNRK